MNQIVRGKMQDFADPDGSVPAGLQSSGRDQKMNPSVRADESLGIAEVAAALRRDGKIRQFPSDKGSSSVFADGNAELLPGKAPGAQSVEREDPSPVFQHGSRAVAAFAVFEIQSQGDRQMRPVDQIRAHGMGELVSAEMPDHRVIVMPDIQEIIQMKDSVPEERHAVSDKKIPVRFPVIHVFFH